ncbi:MAG: P-type conjugative transfer protein TrbL, partial [Caulobacterales bacterium]|nr:P-type conjugative transfer protein TrbL [Caulobacterales bacterium]
GGAALAGGAAAAARGGAALAGGATTAYSLGAAGQSGASGVASGLGNVASTGVSKAGSAIASPFRRAAASMRESFDAGGRAVSGEAASADESGSAATSAAAPSAGNPPAWARRMKRGQQMTHGVQAAAHAVKSGDAHGGGASVNLSESD